MANYFDEMGWSPLNDGEVPDHMAHINRLLRDFNIFASEMGVRLPPPASRTTVEELQKETIQEEGKQCTICLKVYDLQEVVKKMPCNHMFHPGCINTWLTKTNSCPLCRHELPTDDEDYEAYRKEKLREKQRVEELETLHNSMFS